MTEKKCGILYLGRPLEDYTKEELIAAIRTMHAYYRSVAKNQEERFKLLELKYDQRK